MRTAINPTCLAASIGLFAAVADAGVSRAQASPPPAVPAAYRIVSATYGVPSALLYAVALAESGKYIEVLEASRPWPWTLNIKGEGAYYTTRAAALEAAQGAINAGIQSIDLGLMQVNWRYHSTSLGSLEAGIDPVHNLSVGADILAECYRLRGDWLSAVGCYHAPNDSARALIYRQRVETIWRQISSVG